MTLVDLDYQAISDSVSRLSALGPGLWAVGMGVGVGVGVGVISCRANLGLGSGLTHGVI